jgi:MmyB-like transcription regulator ligand binding domain
MSVEYYAQLERGALAGVSAGVLDALARALQLDDAERVHLLRLAQEADGSSRILRRPRPKQWSIRPSLQWTLDAITTAPAIVGNDRLDFLAANQLGRAMYSDLLLDPSAPPNFARHIFLDSSARRFYPNWDQAADLGVANLRTAAGKTPTTSAYTDSSASCPPEAWSSAAAGKPTTSALTAPVSNTSTMLSSAISNSPTRASTSEPNPDSPSPSTQQNQTPQPPTPSACSAHWPPPRPSRVE